MKLGLISDTHGVLPTWALDAFRAAQLDHILHAGDIGPLRLLAQLEAIAPVTAVRGNCDPFSPLPSVERLTISDITIYLAHKPETLARAIQKNQATGVTLGINGHLHIPSYTHQDNNTVIMSPGSPSEPRAGSKPSIALVQLQDSTILSHQFITA
ncbi:MAG: metallophosphatase family protein [Coriobacteriia bacterium]|nr:metallophosphatase family protein [Coriobacteriia bacterium]